MNTARYVPEGDDYNLDEDTHERVLDLTADGVDPMRFLTMSESDTAEGIIGGIDSLERLAGWRLANQSFLNPPSSDITEAIDEREAELTGEPTPDVSPEPVAATDGGTTATDPTSVGTTETTADHQETDADAAATDAESEARTTVASAPELHPDVRGLEAGDVLRVDRGERTAYVWPSSADADAPYQSLEVNDNGERRFDPIGMTTDQFARWLGDDAETVPADDVDVRPPAKAVTGGEA